MQMYDIQNADAQLASPPKTNKAGLHPSLPIDQIISPFLFFALGIHQGAARASTTKKRTGEN